jgi:eukaryotic-like serine/threonine-protein kinase
MRAAMMTLRERLDALLDAHDGSKGLLTPLILPRTPEEKPGDHFGRYKLLLKLGEGGCGLVYMAEQAEPVRRRVALKIIKAGMDTREVIARFEAERQALALMDHPGICKVLDAGATDAGRPFFVMELVRGIPITRYCDENQLPTRARLELFMQVCNAVQHAHQKGIIHRDLKPSNILVTLHGTAAMPKVIDFGIAKATQGRLTDATLVTAFEQFLGTPAYMSPEQAEMSPLDIDTRSDVYSLGVLLYELLTGRPPFDPKVLMVASHSELCRIIREVEPPKPSTHLSTLAETDRSTVAQRRSTDPAKLRMLLSGDLDWIVMRALEKKRARRYDTPAALADDIARHLQHEPVVARPPGNLYRLGKFARRHQVGVAAGTVVALTLVAGSIVSTAQAVRATRAEHAANAERSNAVAARTRAEDLLDFMLGDLREEVRKAGKLDLLDRVGEEATAYFDSLDPHELSDATLLRQIKMLRQIGATRKEQARYADAQRAFSAAYHRSATLTARHPANGDMLYERSQAEYWMGFMHRRLGETGKAAEWLTRHRDSSVRLIQIEPGNPRFQSEFIDGHHNVAVIEMERGKIDDARTAFLGEIAMLESMIHAHPDDLRSRLRLTDVLSWLGTAAFQQGDFSEALERYRDEASRLESLLARDSVDMKWKFELADSLSKQVNVLIATGRLADARERLARASAILKTLVAHDPANRIWLDASLNARMKEIMLEQAGGQLSSASAGITEVRTKIESLVVAEPADRKFVGRLMTALRLESELRLETGSSDAAETANRAVEHAASVVNDPRVDKILGECAQAHVTAGRVADAAGQREVARRHWERALDMLKAHVVDSRDCLLLDPAARALALLGRHDESLKLVTRLHGLGYRPLRPWPDTDASNLSTRSNQNK